MTEIYADFPTAASSTCTSVQSSLSNYLDGVVTGVEMLGIADHLETCSACAAEFAVIREMQKTLTSMGAVKPPQELGLKLRLAISHEQERSWSRRAERLMLGWQNTMRPFVMKASAGLACAVVFLGSILFLLGAMSAANPVMANDEPLGAMTAPHYLYSMAGIQSIVTPADSTIVIEASINSRGQVYDYRIVSGPQDSVVRNQVAEQLLASVFQPASVFGVPVRGHVIMTFAGVSVRG